MEAIFFTLAKRNNSTKQPDENTVRWVVEVDLLEPFSLTAPQIVVRYPEEAPEGGAPFVYRYNYCYIGELGARYYFISGWSWANGLWTASLAVDVLGSYALDIGYNRFFVERATNGYNDGIVDFLTVATGGSKRVQSFGQPYPFTENPSYWLYVISVAGSNGIDRYLCDASGFSDFTKKLFSENFWTNLAVEFFNPMEQILSVIAYPFDMETGFTIYTSFSNEYDAVSSVDLGWINMGVKENFALKITPVRKIVESDYISNARTFELTFNVPKHPKATSYSSYLNLAPFRNIHLNWLPFGGKQLDSSLVKDRVDLDITTDFTNGEAEYKIYGYGTSAGDVNILDVGMFQLGISIPLTQVGRDWDGVIASIASLAAASAAPQANSLLLAAGASLSAAGDLIKPTVRTSGNFENVLSIVGKPFISANFANVALPDAASEGLPVMDYCLLQDLKGGFIKCRNASFPLTSTPLRTRWMTNKEREMISQYLNGGFYYE